MFRRGRAGTPIDRLDLTDPEIGPLEEGTGPPGGIGPVPGETGPPGGIGPAPGETGPPGGFGPPPGATGPLGGVWPAAGEPGPPGGVGPAPGETGSGPPAGRPAGAGSGWGPADHPGPAPGRPGEAGPPGGAGRRAGHKTRLSFRTRLATAAAVAVGVAVALAAAASFFVVRGRLLSQVDQSLRRQADLVAQTNPIDPRGNVDLGQLRVLRNIRLSGLITIQVVRDDGTVLIGDSQTQIPFTQTDRQVADGQRQSAIHSVSATSSSPHERVLAFPAGPGYAFQLAYPLTDIDHTLRELGVVLLVVALAGIGLALALGYLVAQAALRPVQRLTAAAEHVAATQQLDATIEPGGDDELGRLARSFNAMLAALGASRRQQSQLVTDAGHELRTPLTSLRTNVEVLAKVRELPESDRQALLGDVMGQLEELTTLVGDLVELAREEEADPQPEELHLNAVIDRALERARRRAPSLTFRADVEPALVRGQPVLLERAVLNLLDNAAKWSPRNGVVDVSLHRRGPVWQLDVRDHGPGISAEDLPFVFDRFYRAPAARALPGSGLGLAIVRQVVESHGGRITADSPVDGGTRMTVELPAG